MVRRSWTRIAAERLSGAAFAVGGLLLLTEGAVHAEQYAAVFSGVAWIGPLFLLNAAACVVTAVGLGFARFRRLAALAGLVISAAALLSLVVSYGQGLFGWQESGFRPETAVAAVSEAGAVIAFAAALALPSLEH